MSEEGGEMMHDMKTNLIEFVRQRLSEHGMAITEESLEFTAERYAKKNMDNPELTVSKLVNDDITELEKILEEIHSREKAVYI